MRDRLRALGRRLRFESQPPRMTPKCSCKDWFTEDPIYDVDCAIEAHIELAFIQRGWNLAWP